MGDWTQEELDEMLKHIEFKLRDLEIQKAFVKHFMKKLKQLFFIYVVVVSF